jgi:archaellin
MSLPVNNFDDGSLNLPEPIGKFQRINGEMVMGGGGCEFEGEAISCSMVEGLKEYQAMVSSSGKKKEEKKGVSITINHEGGHTQDSTVWHSPAKDKSSGAAYNTANMRANASSLSLATQQAGGDDVDLEHNSVTIRLPKEYHDLHLAEWLEQLWTKPLRPEHPTRLLQIPELPERDLTSAEIDALRKDLNALLTDKCKNFLTELAKTINNSQTPYNSDPNVNTATNTYSDIINLFDEVRLQTAKNNGFRLTNGRAMMSTTRSGANREKIVVNVERGSNRDFSKVDLARAQNLIHEFIHIYSRESTTHFQMSNYAYAAAQKFDKDFKFILREKGDNIMKLNPTTTFDDFRSADFGTILRKYCDGK